MTDERDQIISFLLKSCDVKNATITQLQAKIAELEKKAAEATPVDQPQS